MDRLPPDRGLANKKTFGVKGSKVRLTYLFASNADGSEKRPPLIIGKAKKPRAFQNNTGAQLGFHYRHNAKAWMTVDIYQEWLRQWDRELGGKGREIILLQDNYSGHIVPDGLQNIRVVIFEPNLTAHVQPMDQGIIRCFKAHYRATYIQRAMDRYVTGVTPSEIYDINQLQAMQLADLAWHEVDTTTIRHCWQKAGILPDLDPSTTAQPTVSLSSLLHTPFHNQDPIATVENALRGALDELEATGMVQCTNRMDIDTLLNPPEESLLIDDTTDEDICRAVLATRAQEEGCTNSGPRDNDIEDDGPVEPCPTYREVLQATFIISRYIDHINSPVARELEATLASFLQQMRLDRSRALTPTKITDYFPSI